MTFFAAASSLAKIATLAPWWAKAVVMPRPMPLAPPVMMQFFPFRE